MSFLTVTRWLLQLQTSYPDRKFSKGRIVSLMHLFISEEILSRGPQHIVSYSSLASLWDIVIPKPVTEKEIGITMIGLARKELLEGCTPAEYPVLNMVSSCLLRINFNCFV